MISVLKSVENMRVMGRNSERVSNCSDRTAPTLSAGHADAHSAGGHVEHFVGGSHSPEDFHSAEPSG